MGKKGGRKEGGGKAYSTPKKLTKKDKTALKFMAKGQLDAGSKLVHPTLALVYFRGGSDETIANA
jgi:hypothetical protein